MPRPWIRLDVGLLDDDRFEDMSPEQIGTWVKAYLLIAREGDSIRDLAKLTRLLTKEGVEYAAQRVDELDRLGWFVPATRREGVTLRGYEKAQPQYRGPSDLPEAKAIYNGRRSTTRAGRRRDVEGGGGTRDSTERYGTLRPKKGREVEGGGGSPPTDPRPLKEILGAFEDIVRPKDETS